MFNPTVLFGSEEPKGWKPWALLVPVVAILFTIIPLVTGVKLMRALSLLPESGAPILPTDLTASLIVPFAIMFALLLLWLRFVEKRSLASIGLGGEAKVSRFSVGFLVGSAMIAVTVIGILALGGYEIGAIAPAFTSPAALGAMLMLAVGYSVQAGVEEVVMRGWLLSAMSRKVGVIAASSTSALLFTLLHFDPDNPNMLVDAATSVLFSLFACYWAIKAGSIWGIIGWHAGWNWFQGVGFTIPVTGQQSTVPALVAEMKASGPLWLTGGEVGPEASIVCVVVLIGASVLLVRKFKAN
ncbi:CPBP family intramembrane glutamic endopeptidase [Kordiimonas lipolytica]|uniref:CPBP family intramembrane glutamic endopeptidase n=1 Tax=Kordiimonas lipolytica TaxID=1662421 RepID=A0ABV8U8J8_9PROT|nr:type II CAAX endopeptidase family protein [Kordiimonas lipolytica]